MRNYDEIRNQQDMTQLLASIAGFHDSMTKEIHMINRGFVGQDHSMSMGHQFDAQVLIQSQWKPFALELVFMAIQSFVINDPGEYWGASGVVEDIAVPVEKRRITMSFDRSLSIVAASLFFRTRSEWLGQEAFLGAEVPSDQAIPAQILQENWRQCSGCRDAWEEEPSEEFSLCPSCGLLTQLDGEHGRKGPNAARMSPPMPGHFESS